jgi:hypothetical protein
MHRCQKQRDLSGTISFGQDKEEEEEKEEEVVKETHPDAIPPGFWEPRSPSEPRMPDMVELWVG